MAASTASSFMVVVGAAPPRVLLVTAGRLWPKQRREAGQQADCTLPISLHDSGLPALAQPARPRPPRRRRADNKGRRGGRRRAVGRHAGRLIRRRRVALTALAGPQGRGGARGVDLRGAARGSCGFGCGAERRRGRGGAPGARRRSRRPRPTRKVRYRSRSRSRCRRSPF